ncbi:MAG: hypothetical protein EBR30_13130 [Cytophagia bacterium]|nr:hypothetical protein [Cytophagia bacterium]
MKIFLHLIIIFFCISCLNKSRVNDLLGEYVCESSDGGIYVLYIMDPDNCIISEISNDSGINDLFITDELFTGSVTTAENYIHLISYDKKANITLDILSDEVLKLDCNQKKIECDGALFLTFYRTKKINIDGSLVFAGGWCEGVKCGVWSFYNEKGEIKYEIKY